jgi:hypothetical protein
MTPDSLPRSGSSAGSSNRRTALLVAGAGLFVLLVWVGFMGRGSNEEARQGEEARAAGPAGTKSAHNPGGGSAPSAGEAGAAPPGEEKGPRFDSTTCWQDLDRFNEAVTIENFREWAAPMLDSRDSYVQDYLKERLTELVGNDVGRANQVLGWASDAKPRAFRVYMQAVRDSEAVHQPQVFSRIMDMGLNPGDSLPPERRAAALSILDTQKRFDQAALDRLANFAKDPAAGEAGWAAARTIGRVMTRDFNQTGRSTPYMDKLLTIAAESPDEPTRYLGQMMPMHAAPVLDSEATERYAQILLTEGNEDGRDAAAHNLSLSQDKAKVLELFAKTFEKETSVCVRWALFRFSARVAGKDALPIMANMAVIDPRFQQTYQEFAQLYASGILDFIRLWNSLPNQDPYNCLDKHH